MPLVNVSETFECFFKMFNLYMAFKLFQKKITLKNENCFVAHNGIYGKQLTKADIFLRKDVMNAPAKIILVVVSGTVSARNYQRAIAKFIDGDFVVDDGEKWTIIGHR